MLYSILCNRRTTLVHDPIPVIDHPRFCTSSPLYLRRSKRTLDCIFSPVDDCSFYSLTVLCPFKTVSYLFLASIPRHHRTQPQAFYDTFSLFGNILSCKVATDENGKSKGYGYVHYETGVSANMAIAKVDGMLIAGKQVQSRSRPLRRKLTQASMKRLRNIYVLGKNNNNNK